MICINSWCVRVGSHPARVVMPKAGTGVIGPKGRTTRPSPSCGNKRIVTDSKWEDSMPIYVPANFLPEK